MCHSIAELHLNTTLDIITFSFPKPLTTIKLTA